MAVDPARDMLAAENRRALASVMRRAEAQQPETSPIAASEAAAPETAAPETAAPETAAPEAEAPEAEAPEAEAPEAEAPEAEAPETETAAIEAPGADPPTVEPQTVDGAPPPSDDTPSASAAAIPPEIESDPNEAAPDAPPEDSSPVAEAVAPFDFDFDLLEPPEGWDGTTPAQPAFEPLPGFETAPSHAGDCERRHLSTRLMVSVGFLLPIVTIAFGLVTAMAISGSRGDDVDGVAGPEPALAVAPVVAAIGPPPSSLESDAAVAGVPLAETAPPAVGASEPATASQASPAGAPPEAPVHVVSAGDTLYGLAARYETTADRISELNGLRNANTLSIGQRLLIPPPEPVAVEGIAVDDAQPVATDAGTPGTGVPGTIEHIVGAGETLYGLSAHYGTTLEVVTALNRLDAGGSIYIGQRLLMPVRSEPAANAELPALDEPAEASALLLGRPIVTGGLDLWSCADFESWAQAQAVYEANLPGDPNLIDGDSNGVACESLRRSEQA